MRSIVYCLSLAALCGSVAPTKASDFPPYCQPTAFYRSFGGERADYALDAADQLQAAGFDLDAQRIRAAFRHYRSPIDEQIYINPKSNPMIIFCPPRATTR